MTALPAASRVLPAASRPRTRLAALAGVLVVAVATVGAAPAALASDVVGGGQMGTHGVVVAAGTSPLPRVAAQSWVVADATTGAVLAAKYPHLRHRPASTLKTLTSITLMPHLDMSTVHLVTAKEQAPVYGSRAGIVAGATYTVEDLWHALLLPSGNDAAAALAATYGGVKKTVAAMNAEAAHLQARDTHAVNPSGLDADGQYTSAYDMALFARAALALPDFVRISGTVSYPLPGRAAKPGKKRKSFQIYGENRLLNHGYKGVIAGKTGYTTLAGRTFWVAAKRGGHTVIVTLMGIGEETETAARALLTWGLANDPVAAPVGVLVDPVPDPPAATSTPAPAPAVAGVQAAGAVLVAEAASSATAGPLLLGLFALAAVLVVAFELFWRRRRAARTAERRAPDPGPGPPTVPGAAAAQAQVKVRPASTPAVAPPAGPQGGAPVQPPAATRAATPPVQPAVQPDPPAAPLPRSPAAPTPGAGPAPVPPPRPAPDDAAAAAPPVSDEAPAEAAPEAPAPRPGEPPEHARPAQVTPTGNVRVVRPPTRPE